MPSIIGRNAYRMGVAVALAAALLQIWIRVVANEDNPANLGFFGVVWTAGACAFTARFRPEGMARAMLATACVQTLLGLMVATAPSTAYEPMGVAGVLTLSAGIVALWLLSAGLFHRSAQNVAARA
jgi:peptidoglycan/LPS O-acetylase OafA/YrhL